MPSNGFKQIFIFLYEAFSEDSQRFTLSNMYHEKDSWVPDEVEEEPEEGADENDDERDNVSFLPEEAQEGGMEADGPEDVLDEADDEEVDGTGPSNMTYEDKVEVSRLFRKQFESLSYFNQNSDL